MRVTHAKMMEINYMSNRVFLLGLLLICDICGIVLGSEVIM